MSNRAPTSTIDTAAFSEIVGAIYDCVVDPEGWPDVMRRIGEATGCRSSSITVTDFEGPRTLIFKSHGISAEANALFRPEYSLDAANFFRLALSQPASDPDRPLVATWIMPKEMHEAMPVFRDWAVPQGFCDVMSTVPLATPTRIASFDMIRHARDGVITQHDAEVLALFAPHVRRAMVISNLFDLKLIEAGSLKGAIDALAVGIVMVDAKGHIIEVNAVAQQMLERGGHIMDVAGQLVATDEGVAVELQDAIQGAAQSDARLGKRGLGIRLTAGGKPAILAHVLPLSDGTLRRRLMPTASAAVFITSAENTPLAGIEALAVTYDMTVAEARIFAEVARGRDAEAAAAACGVSEGTARTHLKRIYAKLGVSRQAELVALVNQLLPRLQQAG